MPSPQNIQVGAENKWTIPNIWPDSTIYILGNGPSLGLLKNNNCLKDKHIIGINSAIEIGDYIDVLFFGDARWYWANKQKALDFKGLKITMNVHAPGLYETVEHEPDIKIIGREKQGFSLKKNTICWNSSSGGAAIDLAMHFGAKKIILFGFDMRLIDQRKNYFINLDSFIRVGNISIPVNYDKHVKKDPTPHFRQEKIWQYIFDLAKKMKITILNATPGSLLPVIPKIKLQETL